MKQVVLVLGADGFIGRHVVAALAASDWAEPVAAGRRAVPVQPGPIRRVRFDATDATALRAALSGAHAVVNCVAGSPDAIRRGAAALFDATLPGAPLVVHFSSMAVYGAARGAVDETAPLRADLGPYAQAKIDAERCAAGYPRRVVLRPGIVYGPGSTLWSELVGRLLLARRLGDLGDAGEGLCNLVYVGDVAAAVIAALRRPAAMGEVLNLAAPAPPTWNGYFAQYAAALGAAPLRTIGPLRLQYELRIAGPAAKLAEVLARAAGSSAPPAPAIRPWLLEQCRLPIEMRSERAQRLLGLEWTPLAQGLRATAHWLRPGAGRPGPTSTS
jgi:nucleoside-diphosphate-sugar epimerase